MAASADILYEKVDDDPPEGGGGPGHGGEVPPTSRTTSEDPPAPGLGRQQPEAPTVLPQGARPANRCWIYPHFLLREYQGWEAGCMVCGTTWDDVAAAGDLYVCTHCQHPHLVFREGMPPGFLHQAFLGPRSDQLDPSDQLAHNWDPAQDEPEEMGGATQAPAARPPAPPLRRAASTRNEAALPWRPKAGTWVGGGLGCGRAAEAAVLTWLGGGRSRPSAGHWASW